MLVDVRNSETGRSLHLNPFRVVFSLREATWQTGVRSFGLVGRDNREEYRSKLFG